MTRVVAIIQARMGSARFPGKVLADLGGKPVLEWVVRAAQEAVGVNDVWVAIPMHDRPIMQWCWANEISCWPGSESDVLARYLDTAKQADADIIVRLTGDCPLLDPKVIADVIALREKDRGERLLRADYASNVCPPSWPDGLDCEVFTFDALEYAANMATEPYDREHVTPFIRREYGGINLTNPAGDQSHIKLSIDTPEDLENVRRKIASAA